VEVRESGLIVLQKLMAVTQQLLERDSPQGHGFHQIEVSGEGRDPAIQGLDECG